MSGSGQNDVTSLLAAANGGDRAAMSRLAGVVYEELRALAGRVLSDQPGQQTLRTTALVNEAFAKLAGPNEVRWEGRAHFFAVAARAMRSILVDYARNRQAIKRGGDAARVPLDDAFAALESRQLDLLALNDALTRLTEIDERKGRLVELRFFGGLGAEDAARVLNVSTATAERDWRMARAWLQREIGDVA